jgi:ribosomal protein S18 acetylase RimI-like enzyme
LRAVHRTVAVSRRPTVVMSFSVSRPLPLSAMPAVVLIAPAEAHEIDATRAIFRDYAGSLGIDLCFQDFEEELAGLPGEYAEPRGTCCWRGSTVKEEAGRQAPTLAGCCALRPLDTADYPNAAEMKRLYVRKAFRGFGLGRQLAEAALDAARQAGYACVLLDTLDDMEAARALYEDLGFEDIPPYYHNPIAGAHYLKADLWNSARRRSAQLCGSALRLRQQRPGVAHLELARPFDVQRRTLPSLTSIE